VIPVTCKLGDDLEHASSFVAVWWSTFFQVALAVFHKRATARLLEEAEAF
jgi:hypothetical protein